MGSRSRFNRTNDRVTLDWRWRAILEGYAAKVRARDPDRCKLIDWRGLSAGPGRALGVLIRGR
jgi:hypothetical protein